MHHRHRRDAHRHRCCRHCRSTDIIGKEEDRRDGEKKREMKKKIWEREKNNRICDFDGVS